MAEFNVCTNYDVMRSIHEYTYSRLIYFVNKLKDRTVGNGPMGMTARLDAVAITVDGKILGLRRYNNEIREVMDQGVYGAYLNQSTVIGEFHWDDDALDFAVHHYNSEFCKTPANAILAYMEF